MKQIKQELAPLFVKIGGYTKLTFCQGCKAKLRNQKDHPNYCDTCWANYLKNLLQPITEPTNLKISLLGRGLSTGTELEYSDSDTIKNALKHRG